MADVWLLAEGEYSDYRVRAVFLTEALANEAASLSADDVYRPWSVEKVTLYEAIPSRVTVYWRSGPTRSTDTRTERSDSEEGMPWTLRYDNFSQRPTAILNKHNGWLTVYGTDKTHVDKAFTDTRMRIKAEGHLHADH